MQFEKNSTYYGNLKRKLEEEELELKFEVQPEVNRCQKMCKLNTFSRMQSQPEMPRLSYVQHETAIGMLNAGTSLWARFQQTASTSDRPRPGQLCKTTARDD
jgi:hypothetical protein